MEELDHTSSYPPPVDRLLTYGEADVVEADGAGVGIDHLVDGDGRVRCVVGGNGLAIDRNGAAGFGIICVISTTDRQKRQER